jgi:hypothetical protein
MIISKKKFEKLVEEEVHKRMNAADEKRWEHERYSRLEEMNRLTDIQVQVLRDDLEELKRAILRSKCHVR